MHQEKFLELVKAVILPDSHNSPQLPAWGCKTYAAVVYSATVATNVVFPTSSTLDATSRTWGWSMALLHRIYSRYHKVLLPALSSWGHFILP